MKKGVLKVKVHGLVWWDKYFFLFSNFKIFHDVLVYVIFKSLGKTN